MSRFVVVVGGLFGIRGCCGGWFEGVGGWWMGSKVLGLVVGFKGLGSGGWGLRSVVGFEGLGFGGWAGGFKVGASVVVGGCAGFEGVEVRTENYLDWARRLDRIFEHKDSFLADHDELSGNEADDVEKDADAENMKEDIDGELTDINSLNYDDLDNVPKLQKSQRYIDIMQKLIVDCNALSLDIENEIIIIHNFIRDKYRLKFPESLVHYPIDYARVVKKIGNEADLTLVDLEGLLPSAIIMVVSVTASTTRLLRNSRWFTMKRFEVDEDDLLMMMRC
ncbi:U4/U6 small nuclear ribonucleoprotein Prp31-like protein [Bienertia sinuspersici]